MTDPTPARSSGSRERILFVSHTGEWTGPTASLRLLLEHLHKRYDVAVVAPAPGPFIDELRRVGIPCSAVGTLGKATIPRLTRLIRSHRVSLVYGNTTSRVSENALIAARLGRAAFICHVRAMAPRRRWRSLVHVRMADAAVAVSQACAASIRRHAGRCPIHVVYNGVAPNAWTIDRPHARRWAADNMGIPEDAPLIVSVAHVSPRKGQAFAVEAMARVRAELPTATLLLVGALDRDPTYVQQIRSAIAARGLDGHVRLLGFHEDVRWHLAAADLFIHTARSDPHPRAVIEAMAARLPVVAFAVDGVAETVLDGRTGRLVPAGDAAALAGAITGLLRDARDRQALGAAARQRVLRYFTAEATADAIGRIIDETLRRTASRRRRMRSPWTPSSPVASEPRP